MEVAVELGRRAERDLRRLDRSDRRRAAKALNEILTREPLPANADDRPLVGRDPWRRLRIGELRILYRPVSRPTASGARLVARIIHRRDLERATRTLG